MVDAAGLLRRPVAADNAAMETEPTKAEPTKCDRHRFQFRLRTLMIVVTLFCTFAGWIGNQVRTAHQRKAMFANCPQSIILYSFADEGDQFSLISPVRRWLGDVTVQYLVVSATVDPADLKAIRETFPETEIELRHVVEIR